MLELDLELLCSPQSADLDIVFVHGLFGNRRTTWTKNGVLWPQQLLGEDLTTARIFTFGYDAHVSKFNLDEEVAPRTIESHAADLCERLAGIRAKTESSDRSLVFVGHSLGGLVCAQAIVQGTLRGGSDYASIIANSTRGMVFLGTPFYGSPVAPWGKAISRMLSVLQKTDTQKIKDLDEKSEKLKILADSFASALHRRTRENKEIGVVFFHETKKLSHVLVVPETNSRIPGFGDYASINADHSTMCKFADQDSPGYQSVLAAIKKISINEGENAKSAPGTSIVNTNWGHIKNQVLGNQSIGGDMNFN